METVRGASIARSGTVQVTNPDGQGAYVFTCDHAANAVPARFGSLGLSPTDFSRHIAWDPGALPVAQLLSKALDAPLIQTNLSRLVLDCNRPLDAPDLIPPVSETTLVPGNADLSPAERKERIELCWRPFHDAVDAVIEARLARGQETRLVSVHSFTPLYKGIARPWHVGIIHDDDMRIATPLLRSLGAVAGVVSGDNEPYSPADRVYFTLERHARSRGLACAMIEIRNDEISAAAGQEKWAGLLGSILGAITIPADGRTSIDSRQSNLPHSNRQPMEG
jgi:predicted N-formylglutamate amidohydrolase